MLLVLVLTYTVIVHDFWNVNGEPTPVPVPCADSADAVPDRSLASTSNGDAKLRQRVRRRSIGNPDPKVAAKPTHVPRSLSTVPAVPTFATEFDNEFVHFFKNVCIAGGLLAVLVHST